MPVRSGTLHFARACISAKAAPRQFVERPEGVDLIVTAGNVVIFVDQGVPYWFYL